MPLGQTSTAATYTYWHSIAEALLHSVYVTTMVRTRLRPRQCAPVLDIMRAWLAVTIHQGDINAIAKQVGGLPSPTVHVVRSSALS